MGLMAKRAIDGVALRGRVVRGRVIARYWGRGGVTDNSQGCGRRFSKSRFLDVRLDDQDLHRERGQRPDNKTERRSSIPAARASRKPRLHSPYRPIFHGLRGLGANCGHFHTLRRPMSRVHLKAEGALDAPA